MRTHQDPAPFFTFTNQADVEWIPSKLAAGVEVKNLGKANGRAMQLVRFQPGAKFPAHFHSTPEFIYLLEGDVLQNGQKLGPGWATVASAGTVDESFFSENGCVFLLFYGDTAHGTNEQC